MDDQYAVMLDDAAWRLARVRGDAVRMEPVPTGEADSPESRVAAVGRLLAEWGYADQPIALLLPSSWCLSATISTVDLERSGRRRAMAYRLEEHLPIPAEDVVADYVEHGSGEALGVCAELAALRQIVDAFTEAGVSVRHLCPEAMLAAALVASRHREATSVLVAGGGDANGNADAGCDLIELHKSRPVRWWWLAGDRQAVTDRLAALAAGADAETCLAVIGGDGAATREALRACPELRRVEVDVPHGSMAAVMEAGRVLQDAAAPWFDLRRDALAAPDRMEAYRKPMRALMTAAAVLLAAAIGVTQYRAGAYGHLASQHAAQKVALFREAFPDQRAPDAAGVNRRLQSELRKLEGVSGKATGGGDVEALRPTSALTHLYLVLSRLPGDIRFRVTDLTIDPDLIRVDGEARSHAEAERVAAALRDSGAYIVEPPTTGELRGGGVSFLFTAVPSRQSPLLSGGPE